MPAKEIMAAIHELEAAKIRGALRDCEHRREGR
jgi:hypothetical protein